MNMRAIEMQSSITSAGPVVKLSIGSDGNRSQGNQYTIQFDHCWLITPSIWTLNSTTNQEVEYPGNPIHIKSKLEKFSNTFYGTVYRDSVFLINEDDTSQNTQIILPFFNWTEMSSINASVA